MKTAFEVLFVISMIVPPAAVAAGMAILLGVLMRRGQERAVDERVAPSAAMSLQHAARR